MEISFSGDSTHKSEGLHSAVCRKEKSLAQKEYTLAIFLDIEGAFNNGELCAITGALERLGVQITTVNWISKLLYRRTIYTALEGSETTRAVGRWRWSTLSSFMGPSDE